MRIERGAYAGMARMGGLRENYDISPLPTNPIPQSKKSNFKPKEQMKNKVAQFRDYLKTSLNGEIKCLTTANVLYPFSDAKADGVKTLEVSKEEYSVLVSYFCPKYSWDGKSIWGVKLVIKTNGRKDHNPAS